MYREILSCKLNKSRCNICLTYIRTTRIYNTIHSRQGRGKLNTNYSVGKGVIGGAACIPRGRGIPGVGAKVLFVPTVSDTAGVGLRVGGFEGDVEGAFVGVLLGPCEGDWLGFDVG